VRRTPSSALVFGFPCWFIPMVKHPVATQSELASTRPDTQQKYTRGTPATGVQGHACCSGCAGVGSGCAGASHTFVVLDCTTRRRGAPASSDSSSESSSMTNAEERCLPSAQKAVPATTRSTAHNSAARAARGFIIEHRQMFFIALRPSL